MNAPLSPQTHRLMQAILERHRATFSDAHHPAQPVPAPEHDSAPGLAALHACAALGFAAEDARLLARAWHTRGQDCTDWPDEPQHFGMQPADACTPAFAPCPQELGLYAVLPDAQWVGRMARAGVHTLQLRFKSSDRQAIAREVHQAVAEVAGTGARLFINDHWRAAIAAGAWGVHLGQEDLDAMAPGELEALRASGLRLGVSTHSYAEIVRAHAVQPSYIALGAVFATTLKQMATPPQGLGRLGAYVRLLTALQYPLVAIGGIDAGRLAAVRATGVGSVAVVRALVGAPDAQAAARHLLQLWQQAR